MPWNPCTKKKGKDNMLGQKARRSRSGQKLDLDRANDSGTVGAETPTNSWTYENFQHRLYVLPKVAS